MSELVGRSASVGVSCVDPGSGAEVDRFEVRGTIERADERWIAIRRDGLAVLFGLPPDVTFVPTDDGELLVAAVKVQVADPDALLELRGIGFVPA